MGRSRDTHNARVAASGAAGTPIVVPLVSNLAPLRTGMRKAGKELDTFAGRYRQFARAITGTALVVTGVALKGVNEFVTLDKKAREVLTLLGDGSVEAVEDMTQRIRKIAQAYGQEALGVAKGYYDAISAGVPEEIVDDFVEVAAKFATAGVTDIISAVDLLTSATNAYKHDAIDAARASDILFATVRVGKTTVPEITAYFANMAPIAAAVGVSLEEIAAWMAALTLQGVPTAVATTQIKGALSELARSSTEVNQVIQSLYNDSFINLIDGGEKVIDILGNVSTEMERQGLFIGDAFANIRAIQAAIGATGDYAAQYERLLGAVTDSEGEFERAFQVMASGPSFALAQLKEEYKAMLGEIGEAALPIVQAVFPVFRKLLSLVPSVIMFFQGFANWLKEVADKIKQDFGPQLQEVWKGFKAVAGVIYNFFKNDPDVAFSVLAAVISTVVVGAIYSLTAAMVGFMASGGWMIAAIVAIVTALIYLWKTTDVFETTLSKFVGFWKGFGRAIKSVWDAASEWGGNFVGVVEFLIDLILGLKQAVLELGGAFAKLPKKLWSGLGNLWDAMTGGKKTFARSRAIPKLAEGGIVRTPTLALIGEAGPEAVVPLSRGGYGTTVYNFTFNGVLSTADEIGATVEEVLSRRRAHKGKLDFQ